MRGFMKKVDLFCYRHPRFGINNLMIYIVIGTLAVWLFGAMDTTNMLVNSLAFNAAAVLRGQVWRLVTFVFIPQTGGLWLFLFLYFYYFVGSTLEREWGAGRFTIYYLTGMLMSIIYGFIIYFVTGVSYSMTANYINLSMFFAFATLFPDNMVLLFFIIPIKMKWLAIIDALYFVYAIIQDFSAGMGLMSFLPLVALLNYFLFFGKEVQNVLPRMGSYHRSYTSSRQTAAPNPQWADRYRGKDGQKPYRHTCTVCGRTDADYPDLEFRYCSRCKGYYCYCSDHINNHAHIQ